MVGLLLTCAYNFKYCHSTSSVLWMYSFLKTFHFEIMVGSSAIVRNNTERSRLLFSSFSPLVSLAEPKCRNDCIQGTDIGLDTSAPPESRLTTCANIHTCMCVCVWACAQSHQSCPTVCNSTDCSPPGSSVHGISQARILEWVAIPYSRGSSHPRGRASTSWVSCIGRPDSLPLSVTLILQNFITCILFKFCDMVSTLCHFNKSQIVPKQWWVTFLI